MPGALWFDGPPMQPATATMDCAGRASLDVRAFEWDERIDRPFQAMVDIVSGERDLELDTLLGVRAALTIARCGHGSRTVRGVITQVEYVATRNEQLFARVLMESTWALLRLSRRRRIFADNTVLEVIKNVAAPTLSAYGGALDLSRLRGVYPPRDYCVQYDETDLAFVLRLLAADGISMLCAEDGEQEVVVLLDDEATLPDLGDDLLGGSSSAPQLVPLISERADRATRQSVQHLSPEHRVRTLRISARARDWKTPGGTVLEHVVDDGPGRDRWGERREHHPGRLDEGTGSSGQPTDETPRWSKRVAKESHAERTRSAAASNIVGLAAGAVFELTGHPQLDADRRHAVLHVLHRGDFPVVEVGPQSGAASYTNSFVCVPAGLPVRPALATRPNVRGPQTAVVVGPLGEEIHTDALGRVRVRFHWDDKEGSSCWLRVAQSWAGPGYGTLFIPRVGMEVVVSFLDGDPDRPLVTGCVYTGTNQPPGELPATKTRTVWRSSSTPGGQGHNELHFEDAAGREQVYLHAQRNQTTVVRARACTTVGGSRTLLVGKDSARSIAGNETVQIGTPDTEAPGELHVLVTGGEHRYVGQVHSLHARSALWTADETIVGNAEAMVQWSCRTELQRPSTDGTVLTLEPKSARLQAPECIELRVGKSVLRLTSDGIAVDGDLTTMRRAAAAVDSSSGVGESE